MYVFPSHTPTLLHAPGLLGIQPRIGIPTLYLFLPPLTPLLCPGDYIVAMSSCRTSGGPGGGGGEGGGGEGQTRWLYEIFSPGPYMRTSFKYPVALGTELVPSFKPGKS